MNYHALLYYLVFMPEARPFRGLSVETAHEKSSMLAVLFVFLKTFQERIQSIYIRSRGGPGGVMPHTGCFEKKQ